MKLRIANCELRTPPGRAASRSDADSSFEIRPSKFACAFTLIEVMVVVVLLALIVIALMSVFNITQNAFRASVTQADVMESGRATMDLMTGDLRAMAPSSGQSNNLTGAANFYAAVTNFVSPPSPLVQPMVGGNSTRMNVLENFFILSRGSANGVATWYGVGYAVATNAPSGSLYSLYRFTTSHPVASVDPAFMFTNEFRNFLLNITTNSSHLMDGVVSLTVRAYDVSGGLMTNSITYSGAQIATNKNVLYFPPVLGQVGFEMFSNTLPASVEIEMGVLEDRALQRAASLGGSYQAQSNYLAGCAGQVHVFRQRVSIPNVDPAAYQ
jgi:type II secretory pathway pseudopilin PulG